MTHTVTYSAQTIPELKGLFRSEIEDDRWVLYHATTSQAEAKIDNQGLAGGSKQVMWVQMNTGRKAEIMGARSLGGVHVKVLECNEFFVKISGQNWDRTKSLPLDNIKLAYDDKMNSIEIFDYAP